MGKQESGAREKMSSIRLLIAGRWDYIAAAVVIEWIAVAAAVVAEKEYSRHEDQTLIGKMPDFYRMATPAIVRRLAVAAAAAAAVPHQIHSSCSG